MQDKVCTLQTSVKTEKIVHCNYNACEPYFDHMAPTSVQILCTFNQPTKSNTYPVQTSPIERTNPKCRFIAHESDQICCHNNCMQTIDLFGKPIQAILFVGIDRGVDHIRPCCKQMMMFIESC